MIFLRVIQFFIFILKQMLENHVSLHKYIYIRLNLSYWIREKCDTSDFMLELSNILIAEHYMALMSLIRERHELDSKGQTLSSFDFYLFQFTEKRRYGASIIKYFGRLRLLALNLFLLFLVARTRRFLLTFWLFFLGDCL